MPCRSARPRLSSLFVTGRVTSSVVAAATKRNFTARRPLVVALIRLGLSRLVSLGRTRTQTKEFEDHVHRHEE
jgi:hypothetical protein